MSQPGAPGQMGPAQGQPAPNRPQGPPMYRAEQMRQMPFLSEEEKQKYEKGLRQLWSIHDNNGEGTQARNDARKKITDFSTMLRGKLVQRKQGQGAAQQQQQQQDASHQQGPSAAASQQAPAAQPHPTAAAGNAAPPQADPSSAAQAPAAAPAAAPSAPQGQQQIPEQIMRHVNQMTFLPTPQVAEKGPEIVQKWQAEMKSRYARGLQQMHTTSEQLKKIESIANERNQKGNPLSQEEQKQFADRKAALQKAHGEAQRWVENFRKNQEALKNAGANAGQARPQQNGTGTPVAAGPTVRPGPSPQQPQPTAQSNPLQSSQSAVNAAFEAAKNQQLAAGNQMPGANGQPRQQQPQATQAAASTAPQPSPVTASHPPSAPQSQPIKIEPGTQPHPHPPPVNTALASAAAAAGGLPSAGTPTQNSARIQTPVTATPTSGAPRSLSHQAALTLANQRGSQPNSASVPGQPPQPGQPHATPQGPGGTPSSAPSVMGAAQPGHPHGHPTQQQAPALTQKLPIPKQLPEKATQPVQPVSLGGGINAGRPTYSGGSGMAGGVMGQPAVAKIGALQLEGEGERVLNRKKLDELVRQVCGGQAEGQEGNVLSPDVEESVLNLADSFVDSVLHAACRNAKERGSKVLEIRDIQLVLERTYNIRIPGYSSDELRTVRKVQPAPGWITKMSAIQAAKVMPGKGDL